MTVAKDEHGAHEHNPLKRIVNVFRKDNTAHSSSNGTANGNGNGRASEWDSADERQEKGPSPLEAQAQKPDVPPMKERSEQYGQQSDDDASDSIPGELVRIADLAEMNEGEDVTFRGRLMHHRKVGPHLTFLLVRDQVHTIQAVLSDEHASQEMVKWVQRLNVESIVQISGTLATPKEPVKSASVHDREVHIETIHLHVPATSSLNFDIYRPTESLHARTQHRILDLRRPSNQAIFRVRSKILSVWRHTLEDEGFLEIQTPKLQPAATESGAEVFKVGYFGRTAFLAQSPQLAKQMAISADLGKVYEVGPVFRAENSNTHRHLTEYTGLDIEMALTSSHYELIALLDHLMQAIFKAVQSMPELQLVREVFPSEDLVWLPQAPVIPFDKGIEMLRQDGRDVEMEDLSTNDEIRLGELVKERYQTDFYVLDKFPASARPFYTKKADDAGNWTRSFDMFVRGQEICTGGQRINDPHELRESMKTAGISEDGMEEYLAAFDDGVPPHGGAGIGLERLIMLLLNLGDVRNATLFHRDPKSLPARPPSLPHPDADTTKQLSERPSLENLIANYGDSSNTSWLDERFQLWYHSSGACIGYEPRKKLALVTGNPLCDPQQYREVLEAFIQHVRVELKLTPVFMLVSEDVQAILSEAFGWRTFTCVEEQRLQDAAEHSSEGADGQDRRRVAKEGIKIHEVELSDEFTAKADQKIQAWQDARHGKQMHLTEVRPWVDREHRKYFAAESKDGGLEALVVLAQLAPQHGWQLKWALDFPGATNGVIEVLIAEALSTAAGPVTFGAAASRSLHPGAKTHGVRAKFLEKTYKAVSDSLGLGRKTGFREKFGVTGESVYICYPKHGVSVRDLREIVAFFED